MSGEIVYNMIGWDVRRDCIYYDRVGCQERLYIIR